MQALIEVVVHGHPVRLLLDGFSRAGHWLLASIHGKLAADLGATSTTALIAAGVSSRPRA